MKKWFSLFAVFLVTLSIGTSAIADDHDDDDDENQEYYYNHHEDHDDDDDDDDEEWEGNQLQTGSFSSFTDYWNIWSREPLNNPENALPISSPGEITVSVNNKESSLYFIPKDGQLLVSGEAMAKVLDAKATFYPISKICVLAKGQKELIVRAGSNAAYENRIKSPMPIPAASYENSVYLPVSVAANALGYRVTWDETKKSIVIQSI